MLSLVSTQTFTPKSDSCNDDECHSFSHMPTIGTIPYCRLVQVDGRNIITFDGVIHLKMEEHVLMEMYALQNYDSIYIPNIVQVIEFFVCYQDELIASN